MVLRATIDHGDQTCEAKETTVGGRCLGLLHSFDKGSVRFLGLLCLRSKLFLELKIERLNDLFTFLVADLGVDRVSRRLNLSDMDLARFLLLIDVHAAPALIAICGGLFIPCLVDPM